MTQRAGLHLIQTFESCRLRAYPDPATGAEPWTIGWGRAHGVQAGDTCTQVQADTWLEQDYDAVQAQLAKLVAEHTPNQMGAMVSLAYNIGVHKFTTSSVLRNHVARHYQAAAASFLLWDKGDGHVMKGLDRRREAEARLYLS